MCLTNLTTKKPLIAEKDIICWKVVIIENEEILSSYKNFKYTFNELFEEELMKKSNGDISKGFHSFKTKKDAKWESTLWGDDSNEVVVKCIIPKGAKYYEGLFGKDKAYASNSIKLIKLK